MSYCIIQENAVFLPFAKLNELHGSILDSLGATTEERISSMIAGHPESRQIRKLVLNHLERANATGLLSSFVVSSLDYRIECGRNIVLAPSEILGSQVSAV